MQLDQDQAEAVARDPWHTTLAVSDILLTDQVAIVTGGGGGIGQGVALGLARFGCDVAVVDLDPERAAGTAAAVEEIGGRALVVPTDVMDTDQVRAAVARAARHFGRVDILVNNAGGVTPRRFLDQSERSWRRHIDINLMSMLAATAATVPVMIEGGRGGSIVNVTSIEATRAAPMFGVYAACKAAMASFTRTMALELAEHGVRANAIAPDWTITPGNHGNRQGPVDPGSWPRRAPDDEAVALRYIPMGREGVVEECASAVVFLCSPMASYITGASLPVDGGTWASSGWVRTAQGGWSLSH